MSEPKKGDKEWRTKNGLHWSWVSKPHHADGGFSERSGFIPDNMSTKIYEDALNYEEKVFVSIRGLFEENESLCMDDESDRLTLCHQVTKWVTHNLPRLEKDQG